MKMVKSISLFASKPKKCAQVIVAVMCGVYDWLQQENFDYL